MTAAPILPGRYKGSVKETSVSFTKSGCIQFTASCSLTAIQDLDGYDYKPLTHTLYKTAYLTLTKKDGEMNTHQVDALKSALGWDGKSLKDITDKDFSDRELSFTISEDADENGKLQTRIDWINPLFGLKKASNDELSKMEQKWQSLSPATTSGGKDW